MENGEKIDFPLSEGEELWVQEEWGEEERLNKKTRTHSVTGAPEDAGANNLLQREDAQRQAFLSADGLLTWGEESRESGRQAEPGTIMS